VSIKPTRREFLKGLAVAAGTTILASCKPEEVVVKETVIVEKPVEKVVKETVVVEKPVEKVVKQTVVVEKPVTATPAPIEPVTIRIVDWPEMVGVPETQAKFEEENPGVTIAFEPFGSNFYDGLIAQCVAGTAPDVMSLFGGYFFAFGSKGQLLDLRPYVDMHMPPEDVDDFFAWHWPDGFTVPETGQLLGMPWKINVSCMIYSKDAFDEIGADYPDESWDHDTYANALRNLHKPGDGSTVERWGGLISAWSYSTFQTHVEAFGGHLVDPNDRTKCLLGQKEAQDGAEWMRKLIWEDKVITPPGEVQALGGTGPYFVQGHCGIMETGLNSVVDHIMPACRTAPDPIKFGVMYIPKGPAARRAMGSSDGYGVYTKSAAPEWAWKYAYFLTQEFHQARTIIEWQNQLPPRKSLLALYDALVVKPWKEEGVDMSIFPKGLDMDYYRPQEAWINQAEAELLLQEALDKVYNTGGYSVDEFAEICEKIESIHEES
jgi:ABC-type glycerol-3-phosphate transport system substrate-binding protein